MDIELLKAKNGETTARYNSIFLHSSYSPSNEALRFVESFTLPFYPEIIILIEPCLSYTLLYFKKKYPDVKFGVIRFSLDFEEYNNNFDYIFNFNNEVQLENDLFNCFGEEKIFKTQFISWNPSSKIWSKEDSSVWNVIKRITEKSKTFLITREYFEKKWFINSCNFIKNVHNIVSLKTKENLPVIIIASGPSLKSKISFIKEYQNSFFIICLSSAISVCIKNNISVDLYLSTDGGYWAGQHLKKLLNTKTTLAIPTEAYCPKNILKNNKILPLKYDDGLSANILGSDNYLLIKRNGTVSGTALDFALDYFCSDIFFFGLDLACSKSYQHTLPNELELNNSLSDNKINSLEKRAFISSRNSQSLEIYKEWFKTKNIQNRNVYRIIEDDEKQNTLGNIHDISIKDFCNRIDKNPKINKKEVIFYSNAKINNILSKNTILSLIKEENSKKLLFPLDFVSLQHNKDNQQTIIEKIDSKVEKLIKQVEKIFNDN